MRAKLYGKYKDERGYHSEGQGCTGKHRMGEVIRSEGKVEP